MKSFKDYLREQVVPEGSTTSDPDLMEKKARKDSAIAAKEQKKSEQITREAKHAEKEAE
jgi:hypothetical protein